MATISRLGQYSLLRQIGAGGMGTVFAAIQESLDRRVAVKILLPQLMQNPEFVERFKREAKAAGRLHHPNVVTIFDTGQDQGVYFYSMELVDGVSLHARIKRGPLGIKESLGLMRQAIDGLSYAWKHHVIHRDIKPGNLMLTSGGVLKIADFGLAKARMALESLDLTTTGSSMGTPCYMSPEQAVNAKHVDHRADIYSLGATFYHLLTGKVPFDGSSPIEVAIKVATAQFVPVRTLRSDVPVGLAVLIERMLAREPENRYQTAKELSDHLDRISAELAKADVVEVVGGKAAEGGQVGTLGPGETPVTPNPINGGQTEGVKSTTINWVAVGAGVLVLGFCIIGIAGAVVWCLWPADPEQTIIGKWQVGVEQMKKNPAVYDQYESVAFEFGSNNTFLFKDDTSHARFEYKVVEKAGKKLTLALTPDTDARQQGKEDKTISIEVIDNNHLTIWHWAKEDIPIHVIRR